MNGNQGQGRSRNQPGGDRRKPRTKARHRLRPEILALEDRRLLSTFTVTDPSDSLTDGLPTVGTLRWAVGQADGASTPSTIAFSLGSSPTTITLTNGQLELSNTVAPITIQGPGAGLLAIDGGGTTRIFEVDSMVAASISGLTIQDGSAPKLQDIPATGGGGVANYGTVSISQVIFSGDVGDEGGALYSSGSASMTDCTVTGTISLDAVIDSGGSATLSIVNSNFTSNLDSVYQVTAIDGGSATITGSTFTNNGTDTNANNISVISGINDNSITLEDCTIADNPDAIGLFIEQGQELNVVGCTISGDEIGIYARFASLGGPGTISGCTISDNARYGLFDGPNPVRALVSGCTLQGNGSSYPAYYGGGALLVNVEMVDCTITGNHAIYGGGVSMAGNSDLIDCTIEGNVAEYGGGVFNATYQGQLIDCTITGNSATVGGGIYNYYGNYYLSLTNTIVAGNTGAGGSVDDIGGQAAAGVTGSFNLIGTGGSGGLSPSDNLLDVANPGLGPLGDYGGPTETIPLLPGSPAIDAGSNAFDVDPSGNPITTDQRGLPRVVNGTVDIGAFESSGFVITPTSGTQSTLVGTAFADPLSVEVTPVHPGDPVAGGVVTFTAPGSGPSATLSAESATIDASGEASVTATANLQAGSYQVTAAASGAMPAEIGLQNELATVSDFQVAWGADSASLVLQSDGLHLLPSGRSVDIPWSGLRSFTLNFDDPINLTADEVSVTGINVASYGPVTITGSGESYSITLAQPINAADRITLTINNPLLGSFTRELDVLPGDVNDDGVVNAQDLALERDAYLGQPVSYIPLIFEDILGDGSVDLADYNAVRARSGTKLPPAS
jgi:hypothetical protein